MQKTIESIKSQTFEDFEVLIIDGKSSKETQEFLNTLESPFFYQSEKDSGIYDAMNKGISRSKGKWLYFLGAGDLFYNENILQDIFKDSSFQNINVISGKVIYTGNSKPFVYSKKKKVKNPSWSFSMWIRNGLHHQATFYKRELFDSKKYDLKYTILSDYWFNLLLYTNKEKCKLIDLVIANCNSEGVSKSGSWSLYKEEIDLKVALSSKFFTPLFYIIAWTKFALRKNIND